MNTPQEYGEQERIYKKYEMSINTHILTVYTHDNGMIIVPNTQNNRTVMSTMDIKEIHREYTVVDYNDTEMEHIHDKEGSDEKESTRTEKEDTPADTLEYNYENDTHDENTTQHNPSGTYYTYLMILKKKPEWHKRRTRRSVQ